MQKILIEALRKRVTPVNVAIVGCGWFGAGLVKELLRLPGLRPKSVITRTPARAISAYANAGVLQENIAVVDSVHALHKAEDEDKLLVLSELSLIQELRDIDVVYEATGDVLGGTQAALQAIERGLDFITINSDMDATIGLRLAGLAAEKGVLYTNSDGDQPGALASIINDVYSWGLQPRLVGNCKGFLDVHQTPEGVMPFVAPGQNPMVICAAADGSKQSFELAVIANAYGFSPLIRGMYGPHTSKTNLIETFDDLVNLQALDKGYIDYTFGTVELNQGFPVFVVAGSEDHERKRDLEHLQKGKGPHYLFFRDYHLGYFEALSSIAQIALFSTTTLRPEGRHVDVVTLAKRDLAAGKRLDGIGGYDCYGLVEKASVAMEQKLLPLGLAEFCTPNQNVPKDTPVTYDMVTVAENAVVTLRREQEQLPT